MIFDVTKKRLMEKLNYSFPPALQFRYKTRVYKQTNLDEKALSKLSTKVSAQYDCTNPFISGPISVISSYPSQASLKKFLEYIQTGSIEKITKVLEKGLDPNFHDAESGGEFSSS